VPVEVVFGQGQGQLFVVRVAGNVVTPTQLGSLEFAVAELGVRLIVVLGHSECKAVAATLAGSTDGTSLVSTGHFGSITERIERAFAVMPREHERERPNQEEAVALNVRQSCEDLLHESTTLAERVRTGALSVVGGVYDLESGRVRLVNEPSRSVATASASLQEATT
jgi:carbonic anhydrase